MKVAVTITCTCLMLFLLVSGCAKEEDPPLEQQRHRVVKRIIRPAPKPDGGAQPSVVPGPREKEVPYGGGKAGTGAGVETQVAALPGAGTGGEQNGEKEAAKPDTREPADLKPVRPAAAPKDITEEEQGTYVTGKGDSLLRIAGKRSVYGDPLKWPILCRYGMDRLAPLASGPDFPQRHLPEGIRLKVITPEEARENLRGRGEDLWIVNVLSAQTWEEIVPPALILLKEGYPVYLTSVKVKGKDWMRLRVGFFRNRAETERYGKKIMALLNFSDLWLTKIDRKEFEEFGGYQESNRWRGGT